MPSSAPERRNVDASAESLDDTPLNPSKLGPSFEISGERLRVQAALSLFVLAAAPGIAGGARQMAFCCAVVLSAMLTHELGHALCGLPRGASGKYRALRAWCPHVDRTAAITRSRADRDFGGTGDQHLAGTRASVARSSH